MAGIIAKIMQTTPTQIANSLTATSADSNQPLVWKSNIENITELGSAYITTQNQGAMTQAHCPIH